MTLGAPGHGVNVIGTGDECDWRDDLFDCSPEERKDVDAMFLCGFVVGVVVLVIFIELCDLLRGE